LDKERKKKCVYKTLVINIYDIFIIITNQVMAIASVQLQLPFYWLKPGIDIEKSLSWLQRAKFDRSGSWKMLINQLIQ
jgi:hypothetical protein